MCIDRLRAIFKKQGGKQAFQNLGHLKILAARNGARSRILIGDPQMLGSTFKEISIHGDLHQVARHLCTPLYSAPK